MSGPLTGTRIIDTFERSVTAVIAGMILADLRGEGIRVGPEGGDPVRQAQAVLTATPQTIAANADLRRIASTWGSTE